ASPADREPSAPYGRRRTGATLADVAAAAGVSTATVSRALNTPNLLTKATLSRVHAAIASTGYIPALATGAVITNRSRLVSMLLPPTPMALFDETVKAVVADLDAEGYQTLLGIYSRDATREQIVTQVLNRRPGGLIMVGMPLLPGVRELFIETGLPIVETWELPRTPIDMVSGISHDDIGLALGNFVLRKGYRRAMTFSTQGRGLIRRYGLSRVLVDAGLSEAPNVEHPMPGTVAEGRRSLAAVLDSGERPDAIICASDWLAQGVLIEAAKRGLRVPDDLAVVGFGDFDFAAALEPALTTVRIDGTEIGHQAAQLMLAALHGRRPADPILDVGFRIVERATT
ncbi:MAG TPA: LacI family DNA-binding transcriptional regulator, partial [Sphingomonadaceae bacterium]|nr:LacI family DNA-binding transcriptional regulator [Sphingomonadaceae bacterium]